jgi:Na+-translocating ferredoxin:NAD+ oxidoreductase RNF subunit RnfB
MPRGFQSVFRTEGFPVISRIKSIFQAEEPEIEEKASRIYDLLPKRDCGACGYDTCYECALAIAKGEAPPDACRIVGKKVAPQIKKIMGR